MSPINNALMKFDMANINKNFKAPSEPDNCIFIRGKPINLNELVNCQLTDKVFITSLRNEMQNAEPYQHIVAQDWFNPTLLELIDEEFNMLGKQSWRKAYSNKQNTYRCKPNIEYGPATNLYFNLVNSGWFLRLLSQISTINDLIPDPLLYGGGLHETRKGGGFGIHADFSCHISTGLCNEMVFITYLNKNWNSSWAGELELWDSDAKHCLRKIEPEFGRSVLMRNGPNNYHGHPTPLNTPPTIQRRSVATYYYTNPLAGEMSKQHVTTQYLSPELQLFPVEFTFFRRLKYYAKMFVPPILWESAKKILS
jgi:2OG-Fe(II) oxygenase superfamily